MDLSLDYTKKTLKNSEILISGSKSESNRLLILQQFFPEIQLQNLSDSDDTIHLKEALSPGKSMVYYLHKLCLLSICHPSEKK